MSQPVITVENAGKKFCKSLKRSMLYGAADICASALGKEPESSKLREDEFWALKGISFELNSGETLGIIGANGSGKSTLLKLLNGIFLPDKGHITVKGKTGALIEVGAGFHPLLTGRENIFINGAILGMSTREINEKFDDIVEFADIGDFLDAPVKHYSSGMYVRLGFAVAVHCDPQILLIDEVLAVGDAGFQSKCFNRIGEIKKSGAAIVLVSHNMHSISAFSERVILIDKGQQKNFDSVSDGIDAYNKLFTGTDNLSIEKITTGDDNVYFENIVIENQQLRPGERFKISMDYVAGEALDNVEVDVAVFCRKQQGSYFQGTNKTFGREINLKKGRGSLAVNIQDIRIQNDTAMIAVAIWTHDRKRNVFWWRIHAAFGTQSGSTGNNFLNVEYEVS